MTAFSTYRGLLLGLSLGLLSGVAGCSKASTLTIAPGKPHGDELLPAEQLEAHIYKRILLLPFEGQVEIKETDLAILKGKSAPYYSAKLEKALLAQGFELISPEIVARAEKEVKGSKLSGAEKAMVMGKETKADAVFLIQALSVHGNIDYFTVEDLKTQPVQASQVKTDKKGRLYHAETEECVYQVPYYEVRFEGKLIDARSGDVLWVGSGRQTAIDSLEQSWVAKLDKKCVLEKENFIFSDYITEEDTLDLTFAGLVTRLLSPMKKSAFAGKPLPQDKPKAKPKPEPKKEEPPPKVRTATVSGKRASLRAGPGSRNQRIRSVGRKTKVEILEQMGEWTKVKLQDGTLGWMHESVILEND